MARAALNWSLERMASETRLHRNTLLRLEAGKPALSATIQLVERVFKDHGITFTEHGVELTPSFY
jgi:transcriptional regulator with XRE-family HTH domain